jgi:hypothetical protein
MLTKAPFQLPPGFLQAFGYREGRRFVALYWERLATKPATTTAFPTPAG